MKRCRHLGLLVVSAAIAPLVACEDEEAPGDVESTTAAAPAASLSAAKPSAASGSGTPKCPEGTWEYDFSDRYMETIAENMPGLEVVEEKGRVVCTIEGKEQGTYNCTASEGGTHHVLKSEMSGGMTLVIDIRITGSSTARFESAGDNRWKMTQADLDGLNIESTAKMNGKTIPVPPLDLFTGLNEAGSELTYRCEGDTFKWKPEIEGMTTDWAIMKRVEGGGK